MNKTRYYILGILSGLLVAFMFTSCDGYPQHTVCEGQQNMIVFKAEKYEQDKYGIYKYAITDASGKDWRLYSFSKFEIGDTLRIGK